MAGICNTGAKLQVSDKKNKTTISHKLNCSVVPAMRNSLCYSIFPNFFAAMGLDFFTPFGNAAKTERQTLLAEFGECLWGVWGHTVHKICGMWFYSHDVIKSWPRNLMKSSRQFRNCEDGARKPFCLLVSQHRQTPQTTFFDLLLLEISDTISSQNRHPSRFLHPFYIFSNAILLVCDHQVDEIE